MITGLYHIHRIYPFIHSLETISAAHFGIFFAIFHHQLVCHLQNVHGYNPVTVMTIAQLCIVLFSDTVYGYCCQ